jgi:hypothetical protein
VDLTALTARLNSLGGFDLSDSEACDLLNDAQAEAARRSRYPRKTVELGPTVGGQAAYALPADFLLPQTVAVAGVPWPSSDRETVRQYERGELVMQSQGVYYEAADDEGNRALYLYPTPSGEDTLALEYVYSPAPLSVDEPAGEPTAFPGYWHPKLVHFVAAPYYELVEDDAELAEFHQGKADLAVSDLTRYDNERQGAEPFVVQISGVTAV